MSHHVQLDAGQLFSGKPSGSIISGYDSPSESRPAIASFSTLVSAETLSSAPFRQTYILTELFKQIF